MAMPVVFSSKESDKISVLTDITHYLRAHDYHFITVTPVTHALWLARYPHALAQDLRDIFGWSMPFLAEQLDAAVFIQLQSAGLIVPQQHAWKSTIRVSSLKNLLFIHSAFPTTQSDAVFFGPDTYRFASAVLEHLQQHIAPIHHAVELCSGAAPAAILIAQRFPQAEIGAIDINPQALLLGAANAVAAGVAVQSFNNDLFKDIDQHYDLIVANPPFMMDSAKRAYRDGGGLYGAELALRIIQESLARLSRAGTLLLYTGVCIVGGRDVFYDHVKQLLAGQDQFEWYYHEIDPDIFADELTQAGYAQVERIAAVTLTIRHI